jgi:hypothetical protein
MVQKDAYRENFFSEGFGREKWFTSISTARFFSKEFHSEKLIQQNTYDADFCQKSSEEEKYEFSRMSIRKTFSKNSVQNYEGEDFSRICAFSDLII